MGGGRQEPTLPLVVILGWHKSGWVTDIPPCHHITMAGRGVTIPFLAHLTGSASHHPSQVQLHWVPALEHEGTRCFLSPARVPPACSPPSCSLPRGRSPEWYNRVFGHLCAMELVRIRDSFPALSPSGPETKI